MKVQPLKNENIMQLYIIVEENSKYKVMPFSVFYNPIFVVTIYATTMNGGTGRFGPLLGVISIGSELCKFLIYAAKNAEVLTCHEIKLKQISLNPGWLEYDPVELWTSVTECMEVASRNLMILDINPLDIIAVGISNQRGTCVLWNAETGSPIYNAIAWSDTRTSSILKTILTGHKGKEYYIKSVCGLPLSTCFSALKFKWLRENIGAVNKCILDRQCMFGTLDTWLLWNLTGGVDGGIHVTDVTNASYTMLMNLENAQWDKRLCSFFKVPEYVLPNIKSCSEIYGFIHSGPLRGIPITSCMGDQCAALLGQLCTQAGHGTCTIDESCFVLFNTGQEIIESENGLLSTVAFKLGPKGKVFYAIEGAVANAGSSLTWLKESLQINTEIIQNDSNAEVLNTFLADASMISSTSNSRTTKSDSRRNEVLFVPAFNGLYSPYWKHDARGLLIGLTSHTTSENVTQAAYEATGFQIRDILESFKKDTPTWEPLKKLVIGGEFSENNHFMQFIADIVGIILERPQTTSPSCLGVMLAAGITMNVLSLDNARVMYTPPSDLFYPTTTQNRREVLYSRWNYAIKKCVSWNGFENYDKEMSIFSQREKDPNLAVRQSIPGTLFLTSAFALLLVAQFLQSQNLK